MKLYYQPIELRPALPFTTASGTTSVRQSVLVAVEFSGLRGVGEAAPVRSYGQTAESVIAAMPAAGRVLAD
ncbi:MAG: hypothetical protein PHU85_04485, partial [Phycisphaerae bacterium]|nr:hypothetical protein [Phycisphaerae bacterium]